VPLLPYLLLALKDYPILASLGTSLLVLFVIGAWKGRIVGKSIWRSGIEMLSVGVAGSILLYVIGIVLVFV
jgi:VIT1/CCC1 family predicted Fe2+/Mn2+ transporter